MKRKVLCLLLCAASLLLSACGGSAATDPDSLIPQSTKGKDVTRAAAADKLFSLNWNEEFSLNPILATNHSNQLLCDLVYENMVELDDNFNVIPNILDEGMPNDDATYWTFKINPDHVFHDGTPVTGADIRYSLERAVATQDRFRGRFSSYQGSGYDDAHFYVTLGIGDTQFAKLLNIPVIKSGTMDIKPPVGSGPYNYREDGHALVAYEGYPGYEDLPVDTIHLVAFTTADEILSNLLQHHESPLHHVQRGGADRALQRFPAGDGLRLRPPVLGRDAHARQRRRRRRAHAPGGRRLPGGLRLSPGL